MTRRRLAFGLAWTLVGVAVPLAVVTAVLELSPRDYLLAWRLRKTTRIECSDPEDASRVVEITEPAEVATIVSEMTARLDRLPRQRFGKLPKQIRFISEDGAEIVAAVDAGEGGWETTFIRSPGERFRAFATGKRLQGALESVGYKRPISLGTVPVEGKSCQ